MSYLKPVTVEQVKHIRETTGLGLLESKRQAERQNAREAVEALRFDEQAYSKFNHTVLDLLQYLIK